MSGEHFAPLVPWLMGRPGREPSSVQCAMMPIELIELVLDKPQEPIAPALSEEWEVAWLCY